MTRITTLSLVATAVILAAPSVSTAGAPLLCYPFVTSAGELLPWDTAPGWNTPDRHYDVQRLTADTLRLLTPESPVVTRMENMRRAALYASRHPGVADELLAAVIARATPARADVVTAAALFDAGYLIETYRQARHLHGRPIPGGDGYQMVRQAIALGGADAGMELAASLMTEGDQARAHMRRARALAAADAVLIRNIDNLWS